MHPFNYSFVFDEVGDKPTLAVLNDHRRGIDHGFSVSIGYTNVFRSVHPHADVKQAADNLALSLAIYAADWLSVREPDEICHIRVVLPVWCPALWQSVEASLKEIMRLYTGDEWYFEWKQRLRDERKPVAQMQLDVMPTTEVALWSGGLDSFGGWWSRYQNQSANSYLLVGSGANDVAFGLQRQLHEQVVQLCERLRHVSTELVQVPLVMEGAKSLRKEPSQRSRGLVFALVGATCAYLRGQNTLHLYENGVGAINLPYCGAQVGLDHARSVHPSSLFEVSALLTKVLGIPFSIYNPFVFATKAQLCEPLNLLNPLFTSDSPIFTTSSCDSPHRQRDRPFQCGYCTSCLLRRQSLLANGIQDETRYALWSKPPKKSDSHPLYSMLHQVETLRNCLAAPFPWKELVCRFPSLSEALSPSVIKQAGNTKAAQDALVEMYRRYCQEWQQVENDLWIGLGHPHAASVAKRN